MGRARRTALGVIVAAAVCAAVAPAAHGRTIIGNWTTTCTTYYFNVTGANGAGNGSCSPLDTAEGFTVFPAQLTISPGNTGQALASTQNAYCALITPCTSTGTTTPGNGPPCLIPQASGPQFANIQYVSSGVYSAAALVIGVSIGNGAAGDYCSLAATASTIQLSSTGKSFLLSYKGYSATVGQGLTWNRPMSYSVRYVLQTSGKQASRKR